MEQICEFREDRGNYLKSVVRVSEAIGEVVFVMKHWESRFKPDFVLILECLDNFRETLQYLSGTENNGI